MFFSLPQWLPGNNADYHDIHHQQFGIKKNFSQPYFVHWDIILGTRMTRQEAQARFSKRSRNLKTPQQIVHTDARDPVITTAPSSTAASTSSSLELKED